MYREGKVAGKLCTRSEADYIFAEIMDYLGVAWWRLLLICLAVRLGGGKPWKNYREDG
jgi:hypothetical protein